MVEMGSGFGSLSQKIHNQAREISYNLKQRAWWPSHNKVRLCSNYKGNNQKFTGTETWGESLGKLSGHRKEQHTQGSPNPGNSYVFPIAVEPWGQVRWEDSQAGVQTLRIERRVGPTFFLSPYPRLTSAVRNLRTSGSGITQLKNLCGPERSQKWNKPGVRHQNEKQRLQQTGRHTLPPPNRWQLHSSSQLSSYRKCNFIVRSSDFPEKPKSGFLVKVYLKCCQRI